MGGGLSDGALTQQVRASTLIEGRIQKFVAKLDAAMGTVQHVALTKGIHIPAARLHRHIKPLRK